MQTKMRSTFERFISSLIVFALLIGTVPTVQASPAASTNQPQPQATVKQAETINTLFALEHADQPLSAPIYLPVFYKSATEPAVKAITLPVTLNQAAQAAAASGPLLIENVGQFDPQVRFLVRGISTFKNNLAITPTLVPTLSAPPVSDSRNSSSGLTTDLSTPTQVTSSDGTEFSNLSNTATDSREPSIAVDKYGHIHVVWSEAVNNGPYEIYYIRWDGTGWSAPINVSSSAVFNSTKPEVVADSTGTAHIIWR